MSILLVAAAAALLLWPAPKNEKPEPSPFGPPPPTPHPTYQASLASLAMVRLRLLQTERLDDSTKSAIDTLTLALVAGSDQA